MKPLPRPIAVLILVLVVCAIYSPALRNGFVWDDDALVLRDPFIRSWRLIPEGVGHFLFWDATGSNFFRPLQRVTFTFDYALFGFAPAGYHATSILLHAAAAVALMGFLMRFFGRTGAIGRPDFFAFMASLLWAIHPLHTSAVTYIAGRADSLAAAFGFLGLMLSLSAGPSRGSVLGTGVCLLAAGCSKESGLTFLLLLLLLHALRRDREVLRVWLPTAGAVAVLYTLLRFSAEKIPPPAMTPQTETGNLLLLALKAFAEYAGLLVAPWNLHMERSLAPGPITAIAGLVLAATFLFWVWRSRRDPAGSLFLLLAFLVAYLPISNLLPLNAHIAEHWLYVPSAFLIAAATLALRKTFGRFPLACGTALALWAVFLASETFLQQSYWRDDRTYVEETIRRGGASARMHVQQALQESARGDQESALSEVRKALEIRPNLPFARLAEAAASLRQHDFGRARQALESLPSSFESEKLSYLATIDYLQNGSERLDLLRRAAVLAPERWAPRRRYISHLEARGDRDAAIAQLQALHEVQSYRADSWLLLARMLARNGDSEGAAEALAQAHARDVHLDATAKRNE